MIIMIVLKNGNDNHKENKINHLPQQLVFPEVLNRTILFKNHFRKSVCI